MNIGITGHQDRPGIDWAWVADSIRNILESKDETTGLTSLAKGADQIFAEEVLKSGGKIVAVIPTANYWKFFSGKDLDVYMNLLKESNVIQLSEKGGDEESFLSAGRYIVDNSDLIIAVWDGLPAKGRGGTADIVDYAIHSNKPVVRIDPLKKNIEDIAP